MNQIGFWNDLVLEKMPASKFLVQSSRFEFEELANNSTLPRFATNLSKDREALQTERITIPLSDPEVQCDLLFSLPKPRYSFGGIH